MATRTGFVIPCDLIADFILGANSLLGGAGGGAITRLTGRGSVLSIGLVEGGEVEKVEPS